MSSPPPRSDAQLQAALDKAGEARRARARVKEQLKGGEVSLDQVFARAEGDEHLARLKVLSLLESLPKVGKVKARRAMEAIGIAETRRVQGLGSEQRAKLLAAFGEGAQLEAGGAAASDASS